MTSQAKSFMQLVNDPSVTVPAGATLHADYLAEAKAGGWTYGPTRDKEKKTKPNILPFGLLPLAVRASNMGPYQSIFGAVSEEVDKGEIVTLEDLKAYCESLLDDTKKKVPSLELGERTWRVWCGYARTAEPNHPNLVATYDELDQGTKDYDLVLNGTAVNYLIELIDAGIVKRNTDATN